MSQHVSENEAYALVDIQASLTQLMQSIEEADSNGMTLFKNDNLTTILLRMHTGARIEDNRIDGTVTIQVMEGEIELTIDDNVLTLHTGQLINIHNNVHHNLLATEESVLLMTNHVC